ncbi:hypothetical protein BGZ60DRAFT_205384 [Tricladium varicosporioides]|nr:hypothetical protein BGZ60DRAFT_205384 [Hymenoscyphus varicosporioides]
METNIIKALAAMYRGSTNPRFQQNLEIFKIIPKFQTLATEVLSLIEDQLIFKLKQEYSPKLIPFSKVLNSPCA